MEEAEILGPLTFVIISLMAGALLKVLLKKIKLPYTVGLFILGIGVGALYTKGYMVSLPIIEDGINSICNLDPDLILNLFLPILIFSAAYELDIHIFKRSLFNSTLLAVPGFIIAMILTALFMLGVANFAPEYSGWNWTYALMFGALISATDPVAVVALLGELGISKRFSTLIDGESMLNDGTGIVLFMLIYAPFTSSVDSASSSPVVSFLIVVFGGLLIGYLLARAFLYYAKLKSVKGDSLLQASVMILLSYITFILAQDIFKLSGVIALVAFGLVIAYHSTSHLDLKTRDFIKEFWGLLSYIANTLIFIIIGVIIADKVDFTWQGFGVLAVVYVGLNLIRMVMVAMLYPIMRRNGYGVSKRESLILTWGALRGALALTLALMVLYTDTIPETIREQFVALTAGVVSLTLVINATTIKWMLNKLGLLDISPTRQLVDAKIRLQLREESSKYLDSLRTEGDMEGVDWRVLERWLPKNIELPNLDAEAADLVAGVRMQIAARERQLSLSMFNSGVISFAAHQRLNEKLDKIVDQDGATPLDINMSVTHEGDTAKSGVKSIVARLFSPSNTPIEVYEVAFGLLCAQGELSKMIASLAQTASVVADGENYIKIVDEEIKIISINAKQYIEEFKSSSPKLYRDALTLRAKRMMLQHERETIEEFAKMGHIDEDSAASFINDLNQRVESLNFDERA